MVTQGRTEDEEKQPIALPLNDKRIQICPHETLCFERMQRILSLPGFKESYKGIEALGSTVVPHHGRSSTFGTRECKPEYDDGGRFWGQDFRLQYISGYGAKSGLKLSNRWCLFLGNVSEQHCTMVRLQGYMDRFDIWLCPHRKISDPWVVKAISEVAFPRGALLDEWVMNDGHDNHSPLRSDCAHCRTVVEVTGSKFFANFPNIHVERFLGKGKLVKDPIWLAQCGL